MINLLLFLCAGIVAGLLISRVQRRDTLLLIAIGVTIAQVAALLVNAYAASAVASSLPALLAAFRGSAATPLAFVGAFAFGYCYWMLNLLAGDSPDWLSPRLLRLADRSLLLTIGAVVVGLATWNYMLAQAVIV